MKGKSPFIVSLAFALVLTSCRLTRSGAQREPVVESPVPATATSSPTSAPDAQVEVLQFVLGRNDYVINVDNTPREFIVHVPGGYDPNTPTPVVIMAHGSNQHDDTMYENTSWAAKAEEETLIVVYPQAWKYPLAGQKGLHEKWNTPGTASEVEPGTELKDDVKFIRAIIGALKATFNVDEKRIFASGFSNGGGFVISRLIPEMNDVFAAYSTAGAGLIGEASVEEVPVHVNASLYSVIGTNDNKISENQSIPTPFAFTEQEILDDPVFYPMLQKTVSLLNLEETYSVESNPLFTRFTFANSATGAGNEYIFMMIREMGHVYPNGKNNRPHLDEADLSWDFFLRHVKS